MTQTMTILPTAGNLAVYTEHDAERISAYRTASKSPKTVADYQSHWRAFETFCTARHLAPLPATSDTVERFIVAMADDGNAVATIRARLAAVAYIHEIAGHPNPTKTVGIRETMKGIARKLGTAPTKKAALTIAELRKAVAMLADDLRGKRDKAMLLAGYFGAFRRSELVALAVDQEGKGKYKHLPVLSDDLADVCPSRALRAWLDTADIGSGPVFRAIDQWGHVRDGAMTGKEVARLVKRVVESTGLAAKDFAGHSLRSGFVTDATQAGASDSSIMEQTGHTSRETVDGYRQQHGRGALDAAHKVAELVRMRE